mmetsp:Transcript_660/g.1336  ORF Transcript_660/g.1336 Transcript_660/m.1336 type:complete len:249 (+) Transcript_660:264-1010(+)
MGPCMRAADGVPFRDSRRPRQRWPRAGRPRGATSRGWTAMTATASWRAKTSRRPRRRRGTRRRTGRQPRRRRTSSGKQTTRPPRPWHRRPSPRRACPASLATHRLTKRRRAAGRREEGSRTKRRRTRRRTRVLDWRRPSHERGTAMKFSSSGGSRTWSTQEQVRACRCNRVWSANIWQCSFRRTTSLCLLASASETARAEASASLYIPSAQLREVFAHAMTRADWLPEARTVGSAPARRAPAASRHAR